MCVLLASNGRKLNHASLQINNKWGERQGGWEGGEKKTINGVVCVCLGKMRKDIIQAVNIFNTEVCIKKTKNSSGRREREINVERKEEECVTSSSSSKVIDVN